MGYFKEDVLDRSILRVKLPLKVRTGFKVWQEIVGVCFARSLHIRRNLSFCKQQSKEYIRKLYFYGIYKATSDGKVMESLNFKVETLRLN